MGWGDFEDPRDLYTPVPRRRGLVRCGGFTNYDGPCGAADCPDCHPGATSDEDDDADERR